METACSYGSKAEAFAAPTAEDVTVTVALDGEGPAMGQDAELSIQLRNSSSEKRTLDLHSQASVMYYTGVHKATVRRDRTDVDILPNEGERRLYFVIALTCWKLKMGKWTVEFVQGTN